jgi:hypothetical protein
MSKPIEMARALRTMARVCRAYTKVQSADVQKMANDAADEIERLNDLCELRAKLLKLADERNIELALRASDQPETAECGCPIIHGIPRHSYCSSVGRSTDEVTQ